jgi:hypothetical protein
MAKSTALPIKDATPTWQPRSRLVYLTQRVANRVLVYLLLWQGPRFF